MRPKRFKISPFDPKCSELFFWVLIYPNVEELRKAANEYEKMIGGKDEFTDCWGLCTPYERILVQEGKEDIRKHNVGIIRLSEPNINSEVAAHECLHAAFWIYRLVFAKDERADFGQNCSELEETFCHIFGEMFRNLTMKLYKHNIWK